MVNKPVSTNTPTWRWDLITSLLENGEELPRSHPDTWLRQGFTFMRKYENAKEHTRFIRLLADYPAIYAAHELYMDWTSERWVIEAAVIADVSVEEISEHAGHPEEVVTAYEMLFYDIRKKLSARGWIMNRVMMPAIQRGIHERDYDMMLKSIAFDHGWAHLKSFMGTGCFTEESRRWIKTAVRDNVLRKGYVATTRTEINNFNAMDMIGLCLKLEEIETTKGSGASTEEANKVFGQLLENCTTTVMGTDLPLTDEPRAAELLGAPESAKFTRVEETKPTT